MKKMGNKTLNARNIIRAESLVSLMLDHGAQKEKRRGEEETMTMKGREEITGKK